MQSNIKIVKLRAFVSNYFRDNFFFGDNGFQNIFVQQPKFNTL